MKKMLMAIAVAALTAFAAETDEAEVKGISDLNFNQTPLDLVFETYSKMVGKTVLKDPNTPNPTITLKTAEGQKLTKEEQIHALEVVLEMNGVHIEPYGEKFVRAVPSKDARKVGIPILMDSTEPLQETGRIVSMMVPFKNISTEEAQKAMEGFKSANGILLVFERTNSILITDTEQNINRMLEIAKMIDVASPVRENVFVRQIKYANAQEIATAIQKIVEESQKALEKDGKGAANAVNQPQPGRLLGGIRRPGQPAAPEVKANDSLVLSVSDADRGMIRGKVIMVPDERANKIIFITENSNMAFFDKVIEQLDVETTPDVKVEVIRLKYADAEEVSDMINDLIGNSASSKSSSGKANQNQNAKAGTGGNLTRGATAAKPSANQRSGESKAGELNKDNVTVLADKRINGLVVMARTEDMPTLHSIIESMDVKLSQVLIETAIVEVTLGDDLNTGVDWVRLGRQHQSELRQRVDADGNPLYWDNDWNETLTETARPIMDKVRWIDKGKLVNGDNGFASMLGGGGGSGAGTLLSMVASNAANVAWGGANPIGSGLNYFFKSDKLNLGAVIKASKSDSRAKYIASPVVMTVDNKEATIEATEARKFFNGYETSSSYSTYVRTPKYDSKDIGITIKVTPKINPNGTVMLEVEEEYSQLGAGQSILVDDGGTAVIDTALTRKMSADILLDNMQTVVLGGLTETYKSEKESGIPILKDIPWIGKWLFGTVSQTETRKELLVFMTPYVLDDADAAQAEAIRRKKVLSDPRPWDDHGWSLSELADPVSKREQLRRLKDEWARQDQERKTKLAIEQEKVKRAKMLQKLSKDERDLWLEMHKEELDKEHQEELEKKMLDDASQEELKELAEQIRSKKLGEAEKELKANEELTHADNERTRLDAEKAAAEQAEVAAEPAAEQAPESEKAE